MFFLKFQNCCFGCDCSAVLYATIEVYNFNDLRNTYVYVLNVIQVRAGSFPRWIRMKNVQVAMPCT